MIPVVILAIVGAALGAFLRPRAMAVVAAVALAGGSRAALLYVADLAAPAADGVSTWADAIRAIFASPVASYTIMMIAGGGGALFAALMCLLLDEGQARPFWLPGEGDVRLRGRDGRYIRAAELIAERPIHAEAERRMKANLNT